MGESHEKTILVSLPLLVRDWLSKEYPGKCCISIKEYHDMEINFTENKEIDVLSALVISPNAYLTAAPGSAYLIDVSMDKVEAHHCINLPIQQGSAIIRKSEIVVDFVDWRAPSFFSVLAEKIGCQCKRT